MLSPALRQITSYKRIVASGGPATFNPSDKTSDFVLSGGNLIGSVTDAGTVTTAGSRGTTSRTSGKYYIEGTWTSSSSASAVAKRFVLGFAKTTADLTQFPSAAPTGWAILMGTTTTNSGVTEADGVVAGLVFNLTPTHVFGAAIDLNAGKVWFSDATLGLWEDFGSSDDPNTSTGGLNVSAGGVYYPVGQLTAFSGTEVMTLNCGASAFTGTIPTGYTAWNG